MWQIYFGEVGRKGQVKADLFGSRFGSVIAVPRVSNLHVLTTLWLFFNME